MGYVFIISSLVILYSDDYMFGGCNIIRFISLFLVCTLEARVTRYAHHIVKYIMLGDSNIP